jgi:hypothetical protein
MNHKQRITLVVGFLLVLGMSLFPPWRVIYDIPGEQGQKLGFGDTYIGGIPKGRVERSGGYRFLLGQHDSTISSTVTVGGEETLAYVTTRIDYYRLATQIVVVTLLTGMAYLILRTKDVP